MKTVELFLVVLITFIVMTLAVLGMSTGVLLGRSPIRGSCGGLNKGSCFCREPCEKRKQIMRQEHAEPDHRSAQTASTSE
jgi:hypothetical protein